MELEAGVLVSPAPEVPVIDGDIVTAIRDLASRGVGSKTIAKQLGIARNTVRRYRREPVTTGIQVRPAARKLSAADRQTARELYSGVAAGNAIVVRRLLAERGVIVSERTLQRAVADLRREQRAAALIASSTDSPEQSDSPVASHRSGQHPSCTIEWTNAKPQ